MFKKLFGTKPDIPSLFEMEQATSFAEFTPDIAILERRKSNLLFVFDEWQEGHRDFSMIEEYAVPMGAAFTKDDFVLYKRKLNALSYAVALDDSPFKVKKTSIRGKLYAIPRGEDGSTRFIELDTVKENGVKFERRRVSVIFPYFYLGRGRDGKPFRGYWEEVIRCYTYIGVQSYWEPLLKGQESLKVEANTSIKDGWLSSEKNVTVEGEDGFFLFDTVKTYTPNNPNLKEYYYYSKLEYEDK